MRGLLIALVAGLVLVSSTVAAAQAPRKETVEGIRNFTVVDPTIGCAGATEVSAIPELARRGYKTIVNLREATEAGAAIDESRQAATAAGMRFIHLPLNSAKPDMAVADAFVKVASEATNQPIFINCASANRASALLMAKRVLVDGWTVDRAGEEASAAGLTSAPLRQFVLDYVAARKK